IYGALLAAVAAPLHAFALPRGRAAVEVVKAGTAATPVAPTVPARGVTFVLLVAAFASYAFVPSGLVAHLLAMFERFGLDRGTAVAIGALFGPSQVGARLCEFMFGRNTHPLALARFAVGMLLVAFALFLAFGSSAIVAGAFMI